MISWSSLDVENRHIKVYRPTKTSPIFEPLVTKFESDCDVDSASRGLCVGR